MKLSTFLLFLIFVHFESTQNAEILEGPKTQYTMIGENITFTCNTIGREAYWVLNAIPMTISYPDQKQEYEDQGVIFLEDVHQQYYNLTMVINASVALNNTEIFCSVIDFDFTVEMSREVRLIIANVPYSELDVTTTENRLSQPTTNKKSDTKQSRREIIALGVSLALVSLVLVIVSFLFLLFVVYHYRTSRAEIKLHKLNDVDDSKL